MGSSDIDKSSKEAKEVKTPNSQEQASSTATGTVNPEWSGFQGYSPMPPHGFLASGPQAHPYMWGVQHLMPPYGTPPHPYVAMYPHGGIYAHPSIPPGSYPFSPFAMPSPNGVAEAAVNTSGNAEVDGKSSDGKEKLPIKRSKGSLGSLNMISGKNNEPGKTSGASANGAYSKSAESGSDGSSEGSDANSQNDERELKRQRRKQSNRESARRSRLRKQAECDELAQRAEALKEENASLRAELSRLRSEHDQLAAQNASLKERLGEVPEQEDLRPSRNDIHLSKDTQNSSQTEPTQGGQ